ncbi:hypothetical protein T265_03606 [Opisthorchis viverrini]|uniref:Uncharacterized protein n=1 Tax=Opisthorchis viverrini TaxID=6198 RepID=A0A074ZVC0_OPIVI|nr:hypothetical protein T265_03606 [Opisthorchis viverrini]KER29807.1 hypothetical protein T265_03606 [Opisthorchis viverrini]
MYRTTVLAVPFYDCETWPVRTAELRRLQMLDNRCLRTIGRTAIGKRYPKRRSKPERCLQYNSANLFDRNASVLETRRQIPLGRNHNSTRRIIRRQVKLKYHCRPRSLVDPKG